MSETNDAVLILPPDRPRARRDVDLHDLDGEAILFDPVGGAVHRLNATARRLWNLCDGTRTVDDLVDDCAGRFEIEPVEAAAIVNDALASLRAQELLEEPTDPHPQDQTAPPPQTSAADGAEPPATPSRRDFLRGGATKALIAAPIISTFFVRPAYASTVSPHGAGGCKNIGFSCQINIDCCDNTSRVKCEANTCCVKHNEACDSSDECCAGRTCTAGTCQ